MCVYNIENVECCPIRFDGNKKNPFWRFYAIEMQRDHEKGFSNTQTHSQTHRDIERMNELKWMKMSGNEWNCE